MWPDTESKAIQHLSVSNLSFQMSHLETAETVHFTLLLVFW